VLHTWNQQMLHHPHLHCLVPTGGLSMDRSRWIRCRGRFFLPKDVLACRFRNRFLQLLAALYRRRQLRLSGKLAELLRQAAFDRFYRNLKKKKWVVYAKRPFGGPEHVLQYLARYTHRIAIANGRLVSLADHEVTFRWRDSADGNTQKLMTVTAVEFIRRFLMHVLPAGFVKIRHFGFLANSNRRAALALCRSLLARAEPDAPPMLTDVQVRAVQRRCPACHTGILHVIGWVAPAETFHLVARLSVDTS